MTTLMDDTRRLADLSQVPAELLARTRLVIAGWSMYPALHRGDRIMVEPLQGRAPAMGELVVWSRDRVWVCHRVVAVDAAAMPPTVTTQGDAVRAPDAPVVWEQLVGRVVAVEPGRRAPAWLQPWALRAWQAQQQWLHRWRRAYVAACGMRAVRWLQRRLRQPAGRMVIGVPVTAGSVFTDWLEPSAAVRHAHAHGVPAVMRVGYHTARGLVGSAQLTLESTGQWRLQQLEVRFRYRGCGIGTRLLAQAVDVVRRLDGRLLLATVPVGDRVAGGCLARAGFARYEYSATTAGYLHALTSGAVPRRSTAMVAAQPLYRADAASALPPELELLSSSVWQHEAQALERLTVLLRRPIDWSLVLQQLPLHQVGGVCYRRLQRLAPGLVPAEILRLLRQRYHEDVASQTRQIAALLPCLEALQREGVRVVALTGLAVGERYYGDPSLRPTGDLDLLIEDAALPAVDQCLAAQGYRKEVFGQHVYLGGADGRQHMVEVHPPSEYPYDDMQRLWRRAAPLPDRPYAMPLPEDLLVFLALHMTVHHVWLRAIWLSDLARIIDDAAHALDWSQVLDRLRVHPARLAAYHALRAARQVCGAGVPDHVLVTLAPGPQDAARDRWWGRLLMAPPVDSAGLLVMDVLSAPQGAAGQRLWRRLVPEAAFLRQRYGLNARTWLAPWYVRRWWDLAMRALRLVRDMCLLRWGR